MQEGQGQYEGHDRRQERPPHSGNAHAPGTGGELRRRGVADPSRSAPFTQDSPRANSSNQGTGGGGVGGAAHQTAASSASSSSSSSSAAGLPASAVGTGGGGPSAAVASSSSAAHGDSDPPPALASDAAPPLAKRRQSVGGKWRSALSKISKTNKMLMVKATETVFPAAKELPRETEFIKSPSSEVESSVALQMLLYFNTWFSPVWFVMHVLLLRWKSYNVETPQEFSIVSPLVLALWLVNEPVRLAFGWTGNLAEKVPQLGTFFLLTCFPTLPCVIFFTLAAPNRLPGDVALGLILAAFDVAEVLVAAYAIRKLIKSQTEKFYLMQFGEPIDPVSADQ